MTNKITKNKVIVATIYIVLGVLFCLSMINFDSIIKWIIGIALIVAGAVLLTISLVRTGRLMSDDGAFGAVLLAFGIYCLIWGFSVTNIIALTLIVLGSGFLLDGIIGLVRKKRFSPVSFFILLTGAIAITIGILLLCVAEFRQFAGLILGIILIVYGVLTFIDLAKKK